MSNRYAGFLIASNLSVLMYRDLTIRQLEYIISADEVYKSLRGAFDDEINQKFFKVWEQWKKYYQKRSFRKAKIIKQILEDIASYSKYERYYLESYIDVTLFN